MCGLCVPLGALSSIKIAKGRPNCVVCTFRCRTTSLYSIAADSSQVPMLRSRSHSVRSALRAPWLTAASALDADRATAAAVRRWLNSAGRGGPCGLRWHAGRAASRSGGRRTRSEAMDLGGA
eukprot:7625666-Pyramimonas_sp.AAC.1